MLFDFANVLVFTALGLGFVGVNLLIGKLLGRPIHRLESSRLTNAVSLRPAVPG